MQQKKTLEYVKETKGVFLQATLSFLDLISFHILDIDTLVVSSILWRTWEATSLNFNNFFQPQPAKKNNSSGYIPHQQE